MNAQDRLAATIAEHQWYVSPSPGARGYCLNCLGLPIPVGGTADWAEFATFSEYAAHLADAITAADDLAVVELPEPSESTERHVAYGDFRRQGGWPATLDRRSGTVYFEDTDSGESRNLRAKTAVKYATNILAAAKAAEAVSDQ